MSNQKILHYGSLTPGAVPQAAALTTNLSGVELAINAADGKLFYKDTAGFVKVLADARTANVGTADITSGSINGVDIGTSTAGNGTFTTLAATSLTVSSITGLLKSDATLGVTSAIAGTDYLSPAARGVANGVASLDTTGRIPANQLPPFMTGALYYAGFWNAQTNTPTLASSVGTNGIFYKVSVGGTTDLNGNTSWVAGDTAIFNGTTWARLQESAAPVQSVNGLTGAVTISPSSIGAATSGANSNITSLTGLTTALSVNQGGTGVTGLTGLVKGNGTAAMSAAVAGVDYSLPNTGGNAQLLASDGAGGFSNVTLGTGLLYSSGVLSATAASTGTVTSVNIAGGTTGLTFSGGPVTNTGTMSLGGTLSIAHGGTGAITRQGAINTLAGSTISGTYLRANGSDVIMSGIQASDVPTLNQNTTGTASSVTAAEQPLITSLGTLTSLTVNGVTELQGPVQSAGNPGILGQVLTSAGTFGPPVWSTLAGTDTNQGTVTSVGLSGGTTGLTFGGGPITSAGTITLGGVLSVGAGGTGGTTSTGTGGIVKENTPLISGAVLMNGEANNLLIGALVPSAAFFTSVSSGSVATTNAQVSGTLNLDGATARLIAGTEGLSGQVLVSGGNSSPPKWASAGTVYSVQASGGTTGLTFSGGPVTDSGTLTLGGTLAVTSGGTGTSSSTGTGSVVLSNNATLVTPNLGTPSAVDLANATNLPVARITGVLPIAKGGTGAQTLTGMLKGNLTAAVSTAIPGMDYALPPSGSSSQLIANDGTGGFSNVTLGTGLLYSSGVLSVESVGSVSSVNVGGGTTGLTFSGGPITSSGTVVMTGVLSPSNGGTGAVALAGLVKGNGSAPCTAAIPGVDYAPATTATTAQLLAGNGVGGFNNVIVGDGLFLANGTLTSVSGVGTVTSVDVSGGTTGLTFTGGEITSSGVFTLGGRLSVANGGTGAPALFGLLKGNGTYPVSQAVAGEDYAPATTASLMQLLAGNGGGGFTNVDLGNGLTYSNGVLNTSGQGPTGAVLSFNGRDGVILPEPGDYDATLVSALPTAYNNGTTVQQQLSLLGTGSGADAIGYTRAGSGTSRKVTDKLNEVFSVGDYGADATGGSTSITAFTAAYSDASPGQVIIIPPGRYAGVSGILAGTKHVTWVAYGYPTGAAPQKWDLPGTVEQYAADTTPTKVIEYSTGKLDDGGSGRHVVRSAGYTGGSSTVVNSAKKISSVVGSGNTNLECALDVSLVTSASSSGNSALKVSTVAAGTGGASSVVVDIEDNTSSPSREATGLLVSVSARGDDPSRLRSGLVIKPIQKGTARTVVGNGLKIETSVDAVITNGVHLVGEFESALFVNAQVGTGNGLRITGSANAAISVEGTPTVGIALPASTDVGIDLSVGIHTTAAVRMRDGSKLSFTGTDSSYLSHGAGGLTYYSEGSARHQLLDNGDIFASGRLSLTSGAVTASAGVASGQFLSVLVNGTIYKIELREST